MNNLYWKVSESTIILLKYQSQLAAFNNLGKKGFKKWCLGNLTILGLFKKSCL